MQRFELTKVSRRKFIRGGSAALGAMALPGLTADAANAFEETCYAATPNCGAEKCLPLPVFDMKKIDPDVGIRPHRETSYRLQTLPDLILDKSIVHNYGHGGAGITMSWGCANEVLTHVKVIIKERGASVTDNGIAILGAGVMGLTAATRLLEAMPNVKIRIYAKSKYWETTSIVAGGQWAPSSVEHDKPGEFARILKYSHDRYSTLAGNDAFGVSKRINYSLHEGALGDVPGGLIKDQELDRLPFAPMNCSGHAFKTLLVEPPIFLKKLNNDLLGMQKEIFDKSPKTFADRKPGEDMSADIAKLPEKIIINCTGLSGGKLFRDDEDMTPIKGHLAKLPAQKLDYMFSGYTCGEWVMYMFPRKDHVIIGGTYQKMKPDQKGKVEATKSLSVAKRLVEKMQALFNGGLPVCGDKHVVHYEALDKKPAGAG
jgi:D-amino-acid oxidase